MFGELASGVRGAFRGIEERLAVAALAVVLVYAGVARAFLSIGLAEAGGFPLAGDNLVMLAVSLVVCGAVSVFPGRFLALMRSRISCACVGALGVLAVLAIATSGVLVAGEAREMLQRAACVLMRATGLVGLVAVAALTAPSDGTARATQMGLALAGAALLDAVCLLLSTAGLAVAAVALPVGLMALMLALRPFAPSGEPLCGRTVPAGEPRRCSSRRRPFPGFVRVLVLFALYGLLGGMSSSQSHSLGIAGGAEPSLVRECLVNDAGLLVGAAELVAGAAWLRRRGVDLLSLRCLALPLYVAAVFLTPLVPGVAAMTVPFIMAVSQALFYGLLWMAPALDEDGGPVAHLRGFAGSCACFFTGTYLGMWLGGDLLPAVGSGDFYMVAAVAALAAVLVAELFPRSAPQSAPGVEEEVGGFAGGQGGAAATDLDALVRVAADRWGLTPRERCVLPGLARGRSVSWVAETLTVSKNTVHTHMRTIYQKAGVHSREELIDAVEALAGEDADR